MTVKPTRKSVLYKEKLNVRYLRKKPSEAVRRELTFYRDVWKVEYMYFWSDTFFSYTDSEFDEFCEMYSEFNLPFWIQTRPETITERRIERLLEIGLHRVAIGIEHGDQTFRREILNRKISNESIVKKIKILNHLGVPFSVNNIVGFPTETRDIAMKTVELNCRIEATNYNCYSYSPFHGTPLRKMVEEMGFITPEEITRSISRDSVLDMPQFSRDQVEGFRRCFVMYITLPRERWPEIQQAESLTPEGDRIWEQLSEDCMEQLNEEESEG